MGTKVLVTGCTGFVGNHVVKELVRRGFEVVAIGRDPKRMLAKEWGNSVTRLAMDLDTLEEDVFERLGRPTHCIHLAWPGLPQYRSDTHLSQSLPQSRNFLFRLLDAGLQHLVVAGTCLEYGLKEGMLSETVKPEPHTAYGKAKDLLRRELASHIESTGKTFQWARLFYLFGQGQSPNTLFGQLQAAIDQGCQTFGMSGGEQVRDYLPVETAAKYLVDLISMKTFSGVINICSGRNVTLKELVKEYLDEHNASIELNLGVYPYPEWEPFRFWGDPSKLHSLRKSLNNGQETFPVALS